MAAPEAVQVEAQPPEAARFVDRDTVLVDRLRDGDESAFRALYDRYFQRVYDFVDRRLGNRADTEETVQEVFINLFSCIHNFRGEAPFGAWVFGVTRRTIASRFKRKQHAMVPLMEEDSGMSDSQHPTLRREPDPLEAYEYQERLARMEAAARESLSEDQRTLFQLHHVENQSISQIARALRKSEDAVKSNLYRARKLLLAR